MYTPPAYRESNITIAHELMRQWSFATLISSGANGLLATQLPFLLDHNGNNGRLITHLARANPQCEHLAASNEILVIFQGPHAFISPSWYNNQKTFPTWNYVAVHAYGRPETSHDPDKLRGILRRVIGTYDTPLGGSWRFDDMPEEMIAPRLRAIVALEMTIDRIECKLKLNQDKSQADRDGVIAHLEAGTEPLAPETAQAMRRFRLG